MWEMGGRQKNNLSRQSTIDELEPKGKGVSRSGKEYDYWRPKGVMAEKNGGAGSASKDHHNGSKKNAL